MMRTAFLLLTCVLLAPLAGAQVVISNWNITANSLSFDLAGTFTASQQPAANPGLLWLTDLGNNSWINNDDNPSFTLTGSIDGHDANSNSPTVFSFNGDLPSNVGLYLDYAGLFGGIEFDFADGTANEVNIHIELTSLGKYNPANISPANLELYWGGDAFAIDTASAIAMNLSTVPEPSTYGLLAGGLGLAGAFAFRRRARLATLRLSSMRA